MTGRLRFRISVECTEGGYSKMLFHANAAVHDVQQRDAEPGRGYGDSGKPSRRSSRIVVHNKELRALRVGGLAEFQEGPLTHLWESGGGSVCVPRGQKTVSLPCSTKVARRLLFFLVADYKGLAFLPRTVTHSQENSSLGLLPQPNG
uniref:Uncharacterized protein n=1 Tax=Timema tahoe TaxID=61484 RepID=A0A7R9FG25_9NEOP|nr:unnamed protein product [Timema tahoe]